MTLEVRSTRQVDEYSGLCHCSLDTGPRCEDQLFVYCGDLIAAIGRPAYVRLFYPMSVLLKYCKDDEIQQSTALRWIAEFLSINQEVMIPFTPRLILAILPNLAHDVVLIQSAAIRTNQALMDVILALPPPPDPGPTRQGTDKSSVVSVPVPSSPPASLSVPTRQMAGGKETVPSRDAGPVDSSPEGSNQQTAPSALTAPMKPRSGTVSGETTQRGTPDSAVQVPAQNSRPASPISAVSVPQVQQSPESSMLQEKEPKDQFDYQATVNALTIQFLSEHEETRVAALKWLIMLHQKAPKKILAMDDGTFPALLKTLSDSSEEVIKQDLQLLAQISSSSEEGYFKSFMHNLLELFSTDRGLLDSRGSLIIRQLCLNLNTERIYRTFAEILEKEEDLEFASVMVQKLNMILITSPELADFRRRLKSLETRVRLYCASPLANELNEF